MPPITPTSSPRWRWQAEHPTVIGVYDDAAGTDDEFATEVELDEPDLDDSDLDDQDSNGQVLSIRRANGEEIVTIVAQDDQWNVDLQPGGVIQDAFLGSRRDTPVWVSALEGQIERDDDGTYVIRVD
ncbi:MAG: hypothetical protein E6Q55_32985 [Mycolicibacterium mageritense]|nr:MAG: hypothetical protein E6Q55_32985 [Mycolicibacterium mageritense]